MRSSKRTTAAAIPVAAAKISATNAARRDARLERLSGVSSRSRLFGLGSFAYPRENNATSRSPSGALHILAISFHTVFSLLSSSFQARAHSGNEHILHCRAGILCVPARLPSKC